jgi:hypothetical protein
MTEITIELPDDLARAIEQRASELGTTPDELLSVMVTDVATGMPELDEDGDLRCR